MTLEQIKAHASFPFRNFKSSDLSFLLLELYWAELFRSVLAAAGEPSISNWKTQNPADRTDGNPILHVTDRHMMPYRSLRVIQRFNTEGLAELDINKPAPVYFTGDAYVPFVPGLTYGALDWDGVTPIEELVLSSDVSEPCERLSAQLIRLWCVQRVSMTEMQQKLDEYWRAVNDNLIEVPPKT